MTMKGKHINKMLKDAVQIRDKGKVYKQATENFKIPIGESTFYEFGFDEPWEIVPGEWVFQIWYKNSRLIQRRFNVIPQKELLL